MSRHVASGHDVTREDTRGHDDTSRDDIPWPPEAQARIAELEKEVLTLQVQIRTMSQERDAYGQIFAGEIRQLTDRVAEQNQQTTALQVRASAEVHVARQEAGMLAEQLDDMRKGQELLAQAQKMTAEQYEARISDLRSSHVRELNAIREGDAAQLNAERAQRAALQEQLATQAKAHQEQLARTQGEVDRLVAQGAERDRRLAQQEAELAAYRAWAAKGGLGRMLSRPEVPTAPRGLLPGSDTE
jgi:chromosome segregation ATPase